jgi:hypothetical protein
MNGVQRDQPRHRSGVASIGETNGSIAPMSDARPRKGTLTLPSPAYFAGEGIEKREREKERRREGW